MFCKTFILLLSLNYNLCAFPVRKLWIKKDERINLLVDLIGYCFPGATSTLLISDSSTDLMYKEFYKNMFVSVTSFDRWVYYRKKRKTKVPCITMILSSPLKIEEVLVNGTWRNFDQYFIILDGDSDTGCRNAQSFLMEAWKNDLLNVIFVCFDQKNEVPMVYSFNPFTDFAPINWQKVSVVPAIYDHPWALFSQIYDPNDISCNNLFFDKTDNLGGYLVKVGVLKLAPFVSYKSINGITSFEGYDYEVIKLLLEKLNATWTYTIASGVDEIDHTTTGEVFWAITRNEVDLQMTSLVARGTSHKAELTYPYFESKISVISQQRKIHRFAGQLFTFLPLSIVALLFITSTLIFFLLRTVFKDPYAKHTLDILRVFLNLGLPTLPSTTRGRIIFGVTLISFTFANIVIQANMNTNLTSKNAAKNVNSFKDLNELKYTVFAPSFIKPILDNEGIKGFQVVAKNIHCSDLKDTEAYIGKRLILRTLMTKNCSMPRKPLVSGMYNTYYTRRNWPILPKISKQLLILFESGITDYHIERILRNYQNSKPQEPEQYQVISMEHMKFSFYIFIALSLLSLIVFFVEVRSTLLA